MLGDSHNELLAELRDAERLIAQLEARRLRALAALAALPGDEKRYARDEVAATLRWSEGLTRDRFAVAEIVAEQLPMTLAALENGLISYWHAAAMADAVTGVDSDAAKTIEDRCLHYATTHSVGDLRRKLKRELAKLSPSSLEAKRAKLMADRGVWSVDAGPGMARFGALLPAAGSAQLMTVLGWMASRVAVDETRTKAQRMADALVRLATDALQGGCSHCQLPARPPGTAVQVTVALSTLLGLDEQAGELNGEPIPAALARALASDGNSTWRRLVTDEGGQLVDYGRTTYRPPAALRDYVVASDRTCRFPGCRRAAANADLDHVVGWNDNGTTDASNLLALCERHHMLKHEAGWRVELLVDRTVVWTTPSGEVLTSSPGTYPVDTTGDIRAAEYPEYPVYPEYRADPGELVTSESWLAVLDESWWPDWFDGLDAPDSEIVVSNDIEDPPPF